jgi:hypothetical protein
MSNILHISDKIRHHILENHIEPFYIKGISSLISTKEKWKKAGQFFETISKLLVAVTSVLSFASGYNNNIIYSFLAGTMGSLSLATLQFSSFCYIQYKKETTAINIFLTKLDIDTIPNITENSKVKKKDEVNNKKQILDEEEQYSMKNMNKSLISMKNVDKSPISMENINMDQLLSLIKNIKTPPLENFNTILLPEKAQNTSENTDDTSSDISSDIIKEKENSDPIDKV